MDRLRQPVAHPLRRRWASGRVPDRGSPHGRTCCGGAHRGVTCHGLLPGSGGWRRRRQQRTQSQVLRRRRIPSGCSRLRACHSGSSPHGRLVHGRIRSRRGYHQSAGGSRYSSRECLPFLSVNGTVRILMPDTDLRSGRSGNA